MLEVAFQAKRCIALGEKFFVNRAVRAMARDTTLARRLMLVNIRSALLCVAPVTGVVITHERGAAGDDRVALVWVMTIAAGHFAFDDRMRVRQIELAALVEV